MKPGSHIKSEADAFNSRIEEREKAGFIPDIRRAVKCEYFYKSFWRDPYFIKLYIGEMVNNYLRMLSEYGGEKLKILDAGCGSGYISLELARAGHEVVAIDISSSCIESANRTLKSNPYTEGFGSLKYSVLPFEEAEGEYDAVLFSGVLHHLDNLDEVLIKSITMLVDKGLILCHEPCHEDWREADAAQVTLIRGLLSLAGLWYEPDIGVDCSSGIESIDSIVKDVHTEYVDEQDKNESGQSPNDNSSTGEEILRSLEKYYSKLEYKKSASFSYRLLGGLRGPEDSIHKIADFLTIYEKYAVENNSLMPNYFYYIGRKQA